jgi:hypothetical protein
MNNLIAGPDPASLPLLNEIETARLCGVTLAFLRKRRVQKLGPPFIKLGRCVRYDILDLRAFLAANTHDGNT